MRLIFNMARAALGAVFFMVAGGVAADPPGPVFGPPAGTAGPAEYTITDSYCLPRDAAVAVMRDRLGRRLAFAGVGVNGLVLEVYVDDRRGHWLALMSHPSGVDCVLGRGAAMRRPGGARVR